MEAIVQQFFNLEIMQRVWPLLLRGLGTTAYLCMLVIPLGLAGGLAVALASVSKRRALVWGAVVLVDLFRAAPPLVLLILLYSGLPFAGINLSPTVAVSLAFFLNTSSYYGEIYRAGIDSVGRGQWEAARSTGLGAAATIVYVVLPQAVRNVLPDLISNTIEVVKLTSIASVVSFPELLYSADMARSLTFNSSPVVLAAVIYILVLWPRRTSKTRSLPCLASSPSPPRSWAPSRRPTAARRWWRACST
jgi:polar amino acid transport system permease protein